MDNLELKITALGMSDHDGYSVVALEMDLWGYGDTEEEALKELLDCVQMQVSFAAQINDLSLLNRPAPQKYQDIYRQCQAAYIKNQSMDEVFVRALPLPMSDLSSESTYATA